MDKKIKVKIAMFRNIVKKSQYQKKSKKNT